MRSTSIPIARLVRPRPPRSFDGEILAVPLLLAAVGAIRVGLAIAGDETFGTEPSIALMLLIVGVLGSIGPLWPRHPGRAWRVVALDRSRPTGGQPP